jgi:DNA primase
MEMPKGFVKSFLYGMDLEKLNAFKPLILTESFWGPLWFFQQGLQAVSLMGSSLTEEQARWLSPFRTITVAMDNDTAGHEAAAKIAERLKGKHKISKAYINE